MAWVLRNLEARNWITRKTLMRIIASLLRDGFKLGTVFGIPITANPSLIPIFVLMVAAFATHLQFGGWNLPISVLVVVLIFASILLHELGHALTARNFGIRTRSINLHLFGGVAQILKEPARPVEEFLIAAAGPAVSLALAGAFAAVVIPLGLLGFPAVVTTPLIALMGANLILGFFNLLPGYPMDGGRLLRAYLWHRWQNLPRATLRAASTGEFVAYVLIGLGVLGVIGVLPVGSVFNILIALFILALARHEKRRARMMLRQERAPRGPWVAASAPEPRVVEYTVRYPDGREVVFTRRTGDSAPRR